MAADWKLRRRGKKTAHMSDLNLTPMIDLMFSILVIFMISAPLLSSGIQLDLPKAQSKIIDADQKILNISIDNTGNIYLGSEQVKKDELVDKIKAMVKANQEIRLMISADKTSPYGAVVEVMGDLKAAGFTKVGLKTEFKSAPQAKK